ncbi:site-specific DNA-methyltransferase [Cronbergia sp. UHCC 0137]|uniref:DNA-methyltransferase n=1 Tax=Cronbergia sp. UHCC 0137 TaxID=3110239 RepID=UPI002B1FABB6|nr:site-specific DNA-methyltransferase [Cronbergia sp. UHCC 0137]MEA5620172.1 site-specific DNA-methyltransferase [Cronbergia sp. UHCC 0137]
MTPEYMRSEKKLDYKNKIILSDNLSILTQIDNEIFDLIITSPPYFQQRDYGNGDLGIGNETTETEYLENLLKIFAECVRVLKKTGTIVFNLGDKYINGNLSLIPYKFAIQATQNQNIFLINQIIWSKLNPTPRQDKRKLIQATEPFFIFAKSKDYYFNLDNYLQHLDIFNKSIKSKPSEKLGGKYLELIKNSDLTEEQKRNAIKALNEAILAVHNGEIEGFRMKIHGVHKLAYGGQDGGRNNQIKNNGFTIIKILGNRMKKDIIESPVEITKNNHHPAVYPIYIIQELIKLLTQEGDFVLDPFCGSGTTCIAARNLNRNYLGIEINSDYVNLANNRMQEPEFKQQELFI